VKKNTLFVILSWLWLSLVVIASLVSKPKYYVCQIIKKILRMIGSADIDKNVHFIFYFLLVFFFIMTYKNTKWRAIIFVGAILGSGIIEFIQPIVYHISRKCDINDLIYNISGCIFGLICPLASQFSFHYIQKQLKTKAV
jgi:VanZ family protein